MSYALFCKEEYYFITPISEMLEAIPVIYKELKKCRELGSS
jgi:hypothetical protein